MGIHFACSKRFSLFLAECGIKIGVLKKINHGDRRERRDLQFLPPRHEDTKIYDIIVFDPL
jgi:hypothetical protein